MRVWPKLVTLEQWLSGLFLVLAGIPSLNGYDCPDDIHTGTQQCLYHYNSMVTTLSKTNDNFYTGMDVEDVRNICQSLYTSIQCTHNLKQNCPDTEHTDIEVTLGDLIPTVEMCHYENFYEVYARNQFCYHELSASSKRCYDAFQANTDGIVSRFYGSGDPAAINTLCSNMDTMITCITNHVRVNCNEEAANFVPILVKPSIKMSEHCKNETLVTTTTQKPPTKEPMVNDDNYSAQESSQTKNSISYQLLLWTVCILLLLLQH